MESTILVSEQNRPFWHLIVAALLFTISFCILFLSLYNVNWSAEEIKSAFHGLFAAIFMAFIATGFCTQKRVYIDIKQSRFKPSLEIGFVKIGKWKTIKNYQYVSVFYDPSKNESDLFEVNLWYDQNKHFELYTRNNFEDAMLIAYDLSEELKIDLLDATIKNKYEWINKEALKQKANEQSS